MANANRFFLISNGRIISPHETEEAAIKEMLDRDAKLFADDMFVVEVKKHFRKEVVWEELDIWTHPKSGKSLRAG